MLVLADAENATAAVQVVVHNHDGRSSRDGLSKRLPRGAVILRSRIWQSASVDAITVLDGGMGRELLRIGAPFRQPEWSALALTQAPEYVVQAHQNFIDAGAQVISTNSYAVVPFHIGEERFAREAVELAGASGRLARKAADAAPHPTTVAGSLPPLFGSYRPDLFDAADARRIIDPLVEGLAEHIGVWLGETLGSIDEAQAVRHALERAGMDDRPLWISFTLRDGRHLASGEDVADTVAASVDLGAQVVLFNCCRAEWITEAIGTAASLTNGAAQVGGYANRFVTTDGATDGANQTLGDLREDLGPERYCEVVADWLQRGATVVGGCCGIEPAHTRRIVDFVRPTPTPT